MGTALPSRPGKQLSPLETSNSIRVSDFSGPTDSITDGRIRVITLPAPNVEPVDPFRREILIPSSSIPESTGDFETGKAGSNSAGWKNHDKRPNNDFKNHGLTPILEENDWIKSRTRLTHPLIGKRQCSRTD
jgi:hypothetical protein